jgi:hypothetical protein
VEWCVGDCIDITQDGLRLCLSFFLSFFFLSRFLVSLYVRLSLDF